MNVGFFGIHLDFHVLGVDEQLVGDRGDVLELSPEKWQHWKAGRGGGVRKGA